MKCYGKVGRIFFRKWGDLTIIWILQQYYSEKENNIERMYDKLMKELFSVISCILVDLIINWDSE